MSTSLQRKQSIRSRCAISDYPSRNALVSCVKSGVLPPQKKRTQKQKDELREKGGEASPDDSLEGGLRRDFVGGNTKKAV